MTARFSELILTLCFSRIYLTVYWPFISEDLRLLVDGVFQGIWSYFHQPAPQPFVCFSQQMYRSSVPTSSSSHFYFISVSGTKYSRSYCLYSSAFIIHHISVSSESCFTVMTTTDFHRVRLSHIA